MTEKFRLTGQSISNERVISSTPATLPQCYQADLGSDFLTSNPWDLYRLLGLKLYFYILSPADEVGAGGIGVASDVRHASGCSHFVSGAELGSPCMDFFNFWHTHPLGGVDVTFGFFEILPA